MAQAVDPPSTGPSELSFLSVDTRTAHLLNCLGEHAGESARYMPRWGATTDEQ